MLAKLVLVFNVENVRVIRDRASNVGKGFGYVQFVDRSSVVLALKLNDALLDGRKLRVSKSQQALANAAKKTSGHEGTRAKKEHSVKLRVNKVILLI